MPFATEPKARASGTGRGCRAVVAAGMLDPGSEWAVFRALQLANFTGGGLPRRCREHPRAPSRGPRDRRGSHRRPDRRRRGASRSTSGTRPRRARRPALLPRCRTRRRTSDGHVRFTAPSVVFRRGEETAVAGGWQPLLAYDVVLANFAPELERVPPPESPEPLLDHFAQGLTTAEVALLLADGSDPVPDRARPRRCSPISSRVAARCESRPAPVPCGHGPAEVQRLEGPAARPAPRRAAHRPRLTLHRAGADGCRMAKRPAPGSDDTARQVPPDEEAA